MIYVGLAKSVVCKMCNNHEIYIVFTGTRKSSNMSPIEPGDSSESELDSDTGGGPRVNDRGYS